MGVHTKVDQNSSIGSYWDVCFYDWVFNRNFMKLVKLVETVDTAVSFRRRWSVHRQCSGVLRPLRLSGLHSITAVNWTSLQRGGLALLDGVYAAMPPTDRPHTVSLPHTAVVVATAVAVVDFSTGGRSRHRSGQNSISTERPNHTPAGQAAADNINISTHRVWARRWDKFLFSAALYTRGDHRRQLEMITGIVLFHSVCRNFLISWTVFLSASRHSCHIEQSTLNASIDVYPKGTGTGGSAVCGSPFVRTLVSCSDVNNLASKNVLSNAK